MKINDNSKMNLSTFLFVVAYIFFLGRATIGNTTFAEYIGIYGATLVVVMIVGLLCIGVKLFVYDKYTPKVLVLLCIIMLVFFIEYKYSMYTDLIILFILMVGSSNIKLEDVVKCHFIVYSVVMLVAMACAILGIIENYVVHSGTVIRYSLGNTYPTDFAAGTFYLILDFMYLKRNKWKLKYSLLIVLLSWIVYCITHADTSLILSCCAAVAMLFIQSTVGKKVFTLKLIQNMLVLLFPVFALLSIGVQAVYTTINTPILSSINAILSNRLAYGHQAIKSYGLSLFGKHIDFIGAGWRTSLEKYFYVDNGYLQLSLIYGVLVLCVFCLGFAYVCYKNRYKKTDFTLLLILLLIAISGLVEPRFFNIIYNAFIFSVSIELFSKRRHFKLGKVNALGGR